jgi:NADH-quinone oxidoreductase subunit C
MSKKVLDRLQKEFGDAVLHTHSQFGDDTAVVDPRRWKEVARYLRDDSKCEMNHFIDITAVDYHGRRSPRFEVVLHLRSMQRMHRIRLKAQLPEREGGENPKIDSVTDLWMGANWFERECFDMFGIDFVGHPDLRRILMYDEFEGHPLRKDYDASRAQPLLPYREEAVDKLPPFENYESMPFGRQTHAQMGGSAGRNLLRELSEGADDGPDSDQADSDRGDRDRDDDSEDED